ncbi:tetratricopeptide repeat protein [Geomesophilobacter sediminis]|uniref:Tetratricopeptide repeat protein n=1 Tax=Geomesophilobacter sediminis TaxID=2798584 RepID=A0A8J7J939_9BACT|nr:tetratricopeptide repeat protein [Geomesophilobacter sediminis]MBJ6726296.1 tetratricopeptide repeat protein [Geomesophilobacter sediminis]
MRYLSVSAVLSCTILCSSLAAHAESTYYKGDLEIVKVSGNACGDMTPGKKLPMEMVLQHEGDRILAYFTAPDIQMGKVTGKDPATLDIEYPDPSGGTGHRISLQENPRGLTGVMHEAPLPPDGKGCNFDTATLNLIRSTDKDGADVFKKSAGRFDAQQSYNAALEAYSAGKVEASISGFEKTIRILEETQGVDSDGVLDPCLYLSVAYCAVGRYDEGYRLQDKAFGIPKEKDKRQFLRNGALVKLFNSQVERLIQEGKYDAALTLLDHAASRYPDLAGLQASRAVILVGLRRAPEACKELEKALKEDPKSDVLKESLAWCLTQQGHERYTAEDVDGAVALYRRAYLLNPKNIESVRSILAALLSNKRVAEADTFFRANAAALAKTLPPHHFNAIKGSFLREEAILVEKEGKLQQAEELYRESLKVSLDPSVPATDLARLLTKARRFPEAEKMLTEQRKLCSTDPCRNAIDASLEKEAEMNRLVSRMQ